MTMRARLLAALLAVAALAAADAASACVMCGSSFGDQDPTMNAFKASVLFLVFAPYVIFFTAAVVVYVLYRRSAGARRASVVSLARWKADLSETPKEVTP
jgi:ABC-type multidrug transport system permease subunit